MDRYDFRYDPGVVRFADTISDTIPGVVRFADTISDTIPGVLRWPDTISDTNLAGQVEAGERRGTEGGDSGRVAVDTVQLGSTAVSFFEQVILYLEHSCCA